MYRVGTLRTRLLATGMGLALLATTPSLARSDAADLRVAGKLGAAKVQPLSEAAVRARADALIAQMTPQEKAAAPGFRLADDGTTTRESVPLKV